MSILIEAKPGYDIIRCSRCAREGYVSGPAFDAEVLGEPGWRISSWDRYNPSGSHYCPPCSTRVWISYCVEPDCSACGRGGETMILTPSSWTPSVIRARMSELTLPCGNRYMDVEELPALHVKAFHNEPFPKYDFT